MSSSCLLPRTGLFGSLDPFHLATCLLALAKGDRLALLLHPNNFPFERFRSADSRFRLLMVLTDLFERDCVPSCPRYPPPRAPSSVDSLSSYLFPFAYECPCPLAP